MEENIGLTSSGLIIVSIPGMQCSDCDRTDTYNAGVHSTHDLYSYNELGTKLHSKTVITTSRFAARLMLLLLEE